MTSSSDHVAGRIVLYGATGYTGGLVARALVSGGARPVLAGRDKGRLIGAFRTPWVGRRMW